MPIKYPDVSKDFPKLIKTLASLGDRIFDYWDDLVMGIYENSDNPKLNLQAYFKRTGWIHLNKRYPVSRELESDWALIKDIYVKNVEGTKYKVDTNALLGGPLKEYATDKKLPSLFAISITAPLN